MAATAKIYRTLKKALSEPAQVTRLQLSIANRRAPLVELAQLPALESLEIHTPHPLFDLTATLDALSACPRLRELALHDGTVRAVPSNLAKLQGLTRLDVWNSGLAQWPDALIALPALRSFMVLRHELYEPPAEARDLRALEHLVLQRGPLGDLPALPDGLTTLDVSYCQLDALPDAARSLRKLAYVSLQGNWALKSLPRWFIDLPDLRSVQMPETAGRQAIAAWQAEGRSVSARLYRDEAPFELVSDAAGA